MTTVTDADLAAFDEKIDDFQQEIDLFKAKLQFDFSKQHEVINDMFDQVRIAMMQLRCDRAFLMYTNEKQWLEQAKMRSAKTESKSDGQEKKPAIKKTQS